MLLIVLVMHHSLFFRAKESFAKVQALYGSPNSHLLQLNSQAPGTPDKHSTPDLYLPFMRATQQDMVRYIEMLCVASVKLYVCSQLVEEWCVRKLFVLC